MEKQISPGLREGKITVPASKSDAQRAYLAAALADGTSVLTGAGNSDDEQAMLAAIRRLGAEITFAEHSQLLIGGINEFPANAEISAGESGLGIRLLATVCAAHTGTFTLTGGGSLRSRPMHFLEQTLPLFGAQCRTAEGTLPLDITGPMYGAAAVIDGSLSSQFVSGLLMALPLASGDSTLTVSDLKSKPYVQMTLQTLAAFGIEIRTTDLNHFFIPGDQHFRSCSYHIDADWSSAAYWLVASAIGHNVAVEGLRSDSLQADKALTGFLAEAGCALRDTADGTITVDGTNRRPFEVDATDCPDLFPALAALAANCVGTSVIHGAKRLEHKESHRGLTLKSEFGKLGVRIDLEGDRMLVFGTGTVKGGRVSSCGDHRIAMCLAIAALSAEGPVVVDDAGAVAKSYPEFWKHLAELSKVER
jgi:3-phosphoshikimate 1-carboxyvinyltransferase